MVVMIVVGGEYVRVGYEAEMGGVSSPGGRENPYSVVCCKLSGCIVRSQLANGSRRAEKWRTA